MFSGYKKYILFVIITSTIIGGYLLLNGSYWRTAIEKEHLWDYTYTTKSDSVFENVNWKITKTKEKIKP